MLPERFPEYRSPESNRNPFSLRERFSSLFDAQNDNGKNDAIEAGKAFRNATEILRGNNIVNARRAIRNRFRG